MSKEVLGISLAELEEPIQVALRAYSEQSDGRIVFEDVPAASQLELTPTKPNSARASTTVNYLGNQVAKLWVIAFAPGDATGDETHGHTLADLQMGTYPALPRFVPRDKRGVPNEPDTGSEIHLTLMTQNANTSSSPRMFAGHLRMLGIVNEDQVTDIGYIGQDRNTFRDIMRGLDTSRPKATLTTGRHNMLRFNEKHSWGEVFGSPHAIYNSGEVMSHGLQVCGFIGLNGETDRLHADIALNLGAIEPELSLE